MANHRTVLYILSCVLLSQIVADKTPPNLILITMDGFRYDYLDRFQASDINNFRFFMDNGVKAEYVKNVFPTTTLVCHYSILTGLYPESHGIVQNNFYDPDLNDHFLMSDEADNFDPKWFDVGAEPIYVTNKKAGPDRYSGSVMLPTSFAEVKGIGPDYFLNDFGEMYNLTILNATERTDAMIHWFTRTINPINLGLLYFPEPDEIGHAYGPDSDEVNNVIKGRLNEALGYLKKSLEDASMLDTTNIIITSDHGMTTMTNYINLDDYLNRSWYQVASEWRNDDMLNLIPKEGKLLYITHHVSTQQTHNVATTSLQRRCNVTQPSKHTTSQQRRYNVAAPS